MLTRVDPLLSTRRSGDPLLDTVLDAFGWRSQPLARSARAPVASVRTESDHFALTVELPGVRPEDIELDATREAITIKARRELERPEGFRPLRRERQSWRVQRSLSFPHAIDPEGVEAQVQDGVLSIRVPRAAEATPRRVPVSRGEGSFVETETAEIRSAENTPVNSDS